MTRYQTSIIWLGLILVVLNLITNIGEFKSMIFGGPSGNGGNPGSVPAPNPANSNPPQAPGTMNPVVGNPPQPTPPQNMA